AREEALFAERGRNKNNRQRRKAADRLTTDDLENNGMRQIKRNLIVAIERSGFGQSTDLKFQIEGGCMLVVDHSDCRSAKPETCSTALFIRNGVRWTYSETTTLEQIEIPSACPKSFRPSWKLSPLNWPFG
ncbi:hypothetical protein KAI87_17000, partial [Myxococcota bacterium]|nr:hypothetical protein [Myxococcota bacterium]